MQHRLLLAALLCSLGFSASGQDTAVEAVQADALEGDDYATEVQTLASDSFHRREVARVRLARGGEASRAALLDGLASPDLEIRLASRELLLWLAETRLERQIATLLSGSAAGQEVDLPGWELFSAAVGDAPADRTLYVRIVRSHTASLEWLDRFGAVPGHASSDQMLAEMNQFLPIDIAAISQGDPDHWGLLLLAASQPDLLTTPVLSSRLRGGLLNPVVAERLLASTHQRTLQRLICHWLEVSSDRYINESMLKISLAYECREIAPRLALKTLRSRQSTPASLVAAMTLLARLEPQAARRELPRLADDPRVWHVVVTREGPIRSQVGDVAVALLLYLDGHDPRQVGFHGLEADPQTIYRDYSLGFDDEARRRRAHERARRLLSPNSGGGGDDVLAKDQ